MMKSGIASETGVETVKCSAVVIGAGVLGCAVAYQLARLGFNPIVLERGPRIAEGVTSRNSGVIHAALYYPPDSLKAQSCLRGKALLYEWCKRYGVSHRAVGKWVVGSKEQEPALMEIYENARRSGATGLSLGTPNLPGVQAEVGIFSAETGIVDPYEYTASFRAQAEELGAFFITHAPVTGIERLSAGGYRIHSERGTLESEIVVNAAGLFSDEIAKMVGIERYRIYPWRGDYFKLRSSVRFDHLIYPVKLKTDPGLGVHLTLGLDGSYRLGPDVAFAPGEKEDFQDPVNLEEKRENFLSAASKYLKGVSRDDLSYESCGIRPKLRSPEDKTEKDFVLALDLPGFINLIGIESPGLTAAIDLAERAVQLL